MINTLLLIQCKDEIGLVSSISRILASHNLNIVTMREFVDEVKSRFFARIECNGPLLNANLLYQELKKTLPEQSDIIINPSKNKKIVVLVTKEYHCLGEILMRNFFNTLEAQLCCVIGNYDNLKEITERFSIPFYHITHNEKTNEQFESEILKIIDSINADYIILAKFMRILSPNFITKYPDRIVNIHHSFLPAFIGANPYQHAYERGVKLIGATAHFVTSDLDQGPIIAQQTIHVDHNYNSAQMRVSGKEIEKMVLNNALSLVLHDRVFINGNRTIVFE